MDMARMLQSEDLGRGLGAAPAEKAAARGPEHPNPTSSGIGLLMLPPPFQHPKGWPGLITRVGPEILDELDFGTARLDRL